MYLEDYPINLIDELPQRSGHNATRIIAIVMEYGKDFSGPGNDVFRINRATGEPAEAHHSNFLHPVLYYYDKLPTGKHRVTAVNVKEIYKIWFIYGSFYQ